jgi:hypothetical protein
LIAAGAASTAVGTLAATTVAGLVTSVASIGTQITAINTNLTALNVNTQYITANTLLSFTRFSSRIKLYDNISLTDNIVLSNSSSEASVFNSDVQCNQNLIVSGNITNSNLSNQINTITNNVNTITNNTKYITSNTNNTHNTILNSRLEILNDINDGSKLIMLSNDSFTASFIHGDINITGAIDNPGLNNNTANINTILNTIKNISSSDTTTNVNSPIVNLGTANGLLGTQTNINTNVVNVGNGNSSVYVNSITSVIGVNGFNTQTSINGNVVNIGNSTSSIYLNGDLYWNGSLIYRHNSGQQYNNAVNMAEYVNQI